MAAGWINSSLNDDPLSQVINCESSHDAWHVLETFYGNHTRDRLHQMKSELQSLSKGSSSLEDYLHRAKSLALSLRGAGKAMNDDELIICILRGLGFEFDLIVATLNTRDVYPSLEGVINKLRDFEIFVPSNVAFYTNCGKTSTKSHGTHGFCGHDTTHKQINSQYQQRDVHSTHSTKGNLGTHSQFTNHGRHSTGQGRGGITRFCCGGPNHKVDEETWYPDTRANHHMTSDTSEVQGIHSYLGNDSVMVGNGNGLQMSDIGQVSLPTTNIKLHNVRALSKPFCSTTLPYVPSDPPPTVVAPIPDPSCQDIPASPLPTTI
ncbi:hypothetical protein SADUNF_Sadunf19G0030600 [Salix dunnii]|uniref:Uncharacterized protein n=1 Tax=Salix dunnii TaxID=1413687 RepID=A0A835J141_9ROSI|nr:hypothetical protein SADUNF_Sadunf19G0030600 [Salix dunnii]